MGRGEGEGEGYDIHLGQVLAGCNSQTIIKL